MGSAAKNTKYRLVKAEFDEKWDAFVSQSPNGTAFASTDYMESLGLDYCAYYCLKSNETVAAILLIIDEDGIRAAGHDFVIYDGIMYRNFPDLNRSQTRSEEFKIQDFIAVELTQRYRHVRLSLHPSIVDIRPFLWVNYDSDLPKYQVDIRYTSQVDISDFSLSSSLEDISIYRESSVARRQEIRYAIKKEVRTEQSFDAVQFTEFYEKTMNRQGLSVDGARMDLMKGLVARLMEKNRAMMMVSSNSSGKTGSMAVFLTDEKRAYYLFGANDPEMRNQHTGTAVLWDAFYRLREMGITEVDLEGVNSPNRGWFKLSFGGSIEPYYEVAYNA